MPEFPPAVRRVITEREGGMCAICGRQRGTQIHHRRPRGMGGSRRHNTSTPACGLLVCDICHLGRDGVERQRSQALQNGWLVPQNKNPADCKVLYRYEWVRLDDAGGIEPFLERPPDRWFCGLTWPSKTPGEPHVCVLTHINHDGLCVCACGQRHDNTISDEAAAARSRR
jgi:5-methylcytosine-specific restriction protein A